MDRKFYSDLAKESIDGKLIAHVDCQKVLTSPTLEILPLLDAAFEVRKTFFGKEVLIHIIDNVQNGHCTQDCHYCAQSKISTAKIEEYPFKTDAEILAEAKAAYEAGAFRHCLVLSGHAQTQKHIEHISFLVKKIKSLYPTMQVCVSPGVLTPSQALTLKDSGVDRINHNLNTSRQNYSKICSTHTYAERLDTLKTVKEIGMELCSGIIIGMGETADDIIEVAKVLREVGVASIPVNLLIPIEGIALKTSSLTPEYCLRVLCLFRLLNPRAEIRVAAGREIHLRSLEVLCLYPANSLFLGGYLNTKGASRDKTLKMIQDAGFTIKSDRKIDDLLGKQPDGNDSNENKSFEMKGLDDLRPEFAAAKPTTP
jgi:biotin synthase